MAAKTNRGPDKPDPKVTSYLRQIRQLSNDHLNLQDLRDACFDLGVNYDNIPGDAFGAKMREFLSRMQRRGRLNEYAEYARVNFFWVQWPDVPESVANNIDSRPMEPNISTLVASKMHRLRDWKIIHTRVQRALEASLAFRTRVAKVRGPRLNGDMMYYLEDYWGDDCEPKVAEMKRSLMKLEYVRTHVVDELVEHVQSGDYIGQRLRVSEDYVEVKLIRDSVSVLCDRLWELLTFADHSITKLVDDLQSSGY